MKLQTVMVSAALAVAAGCASMEDRDAFQDKRIEFNRAAIACGSNTECLRKLEPKKTAGPER